ncbi:D-alanine--D-alanine ligase [uncultured Gammaproteobacteria bacterium]
MSGKNKQVAVLMGGWSAEREVSLIGGASVVKALIEAGYRVSVVDVHRDLDALLKALTPRPDVVFNVLHGRGGEDGHIQGVLEFLHIPYTHSGLRASAVAMDKALTKQILANAGVRSPRGVVLSHKDWLSLGDDHHPLPPPYIVKPVDEGSTFGVRLVHPGERPPLAADEWVFGPAALVEEFVPGRELTVGVIGDQSLAVTEIVFGGEIYDYGAKYTAGGSHHVIPADLPAEVYDEALRLALVAHRTLGCRGVSRSDFRYHSDIPGPEGLYFLEINNQPGMTPVSLVPEQARHCGISYCDLVSWMVENAACQL